MENCFRVLLAKQGKKVVDVHKATGLSKSTLTGLYYGRLESPKITTVRKIADYLGVTMDELMAPIE